MMTLRGGTPAQIPYCYSMAEKHEPELCKRLGRDPSEVFHRASWFQLVCIKYKGYAEFFDTDEHRFEQSPEESGMLRERFSRYLPEELPPGSRINEYGVVSYQPAGTEGHLRRLINPLTHATRISQLDGYPFPDAGKDWRWSSRN